MTHLHELWLPILLSSMMVFVVSSIIHMALPWHKSDYSSVPGEDKVMDALRPFAIPAGDYMLPRPSGPKELGTPAFKDKLQKGPVVVFTVMPQGGMPIGRNMIFWFLYSLVIGVIVAYVSGRAVGPGGSYLQVFRFAGATAFISYSLGLWQMSIWYCRSWTTTLKSTIDGLIYALLTAGTFGWLWPR
ncbi:MAG TPA: hypothetical protein VG273_20135 [Bryobacteraceae bacterium]|jgi:hypothetical protein|nr:hypothetical protein [Bryobacteraceae bacterium]